MKKARKRISLILAICMLISMLPVTSYAETVEPESTIIKTVAPYVIPSTTGAAISVGKQEGVLLEGIQSTDDGMFSHVRYKVDTEYIGKGTYSATVANLPQGVSVNGGVVNIDKDGSGTLKLEGNTYTVSGTAKDLTLTIKGGSLPEEGVTSEPFELTIVDIEFIELNMEYYIKSLETLIPYQIIAFLHNKPNAYAEGKDDIELEEAIEETLEKFAEKGEKFNKLFNDEDSLNKYIKDPDSLIDEIDKLLKDYKDASDALAAIAKPFFKDAAWEYVQLNQRVLLLSTYRMNLGLQIGKIDIDDFNAIENKLMSELKEIIIKHFGSDEVDFLEVEDKAIAEGDWEILAVLYTDVYNFLYNILEEYGIVGGNADDDDDNGGSNGGSKDKDTSGPAGPAVPTVPTTPTPPAETAQKPVEQVLNDVETHWALNSIQFVYDRGIMTGTSAEQFSPDARMSRGMLITALGRLAGINTLDFTSGSFNDVDMSSYYGPYAEWSLRSNITRGTGNNNFSPDSPVTREELAVILVNFASAMRYYLPSGEGAQSFADNSTISPWAMEAIEIMRNADIMQGDPDNNFNPKAPATRAEIAAVLQRFIEYMGL
ncbi:S-layer homology domain-containing protein [Sedimentibacter sp.]|uniref:S-layer homology domain-containing protein n=1 Tax=Sedimentibacter sp. TaxID=1960295 RepID=UPI000EE2BEC1|nr:S-layer homology domain-containing protein [Sedimentibacter sp.]HCX60854.1 hypothetical protein [Clostridiales bacterium]